MIKRPLWLRAFTLSTVRTRLLRILLATALSAGLLSGAGCVYRMDIQQGNRLEESAVAQVEVGMTRSQVQFLLGTPMIADPFRRDRWDYPYWLRQGRAREVQQRWLVVYFEGDRVVRLERRLDAESGVS